MIKYRIVQSRQSGGLGTKIRESEHWLIISLAFEIYEVPKGFKLLLLERVNGMWITLKEK